MISKMNYKTLQENNKYNNKIRRRKQTLENHIIELFIEYLTLKEETLKDTENRLKGQNNE